LPFVLQQIAEIVVRHQGAAFARIWTLNPGTGLLELRASAGLYTHLDGAYACIPVGEGRSARSQRKANPFLTNSAIGDPGILDQEWARREGCGRLPGSRCALKAA